MNRPDPKSLNAWDDLLHAWQMPWLAGAEWLDLCAEAAHVAGTHPPHADTPLFSFEDTPFHIEDEPGLYA